MAKSSEWHHVWVGKVLRGWVVFVDFDWCPSGKVENKICNLWQPFCDREDTSWHFNHGENGFIKGMKSRIKKTWLGVQVIDLGFMFVTERHRFGDFCTCQTLPDEQNLFLVWNIFCGNRPSHNSPLRAVPGIFLPVQNISVWAPQISQQLFCLKRMMPIEGRVNLSCFFNFSEDTNSLVNVRGENRAQQKLKEVLEKLY